MIGHRLNGCVIVMAEPSVLTECWTILAVRRDLSNGPGDPYVVATVAVWDMPTPDHWSNGYYTSDLNKALDAYTAKTTGLVRKPIQQLLDVLNDKDAHSNPQPDFVQLFEALAACEAPEGSQVDNVLASFQARYFQQKENR